MIETMNLLSESAVVMLIGIGVVCTFLMVFIIFTIIMGKNIQVSGVDDKTALAENISN